MENGKQKLSDEIIKVLRNSEFQNFIAKFNTPRWPNYISFGLVSFAIALIIGTLYWDVYQSEKVVYQKWLAKEMKEKARAVSSVDGAMSRFTSNLQTIASQCSEPFFNLKKQLKLREEVRNNLEVVSAGPYLEKDITDSLNNLVNLEESVLDICKMSEIDRSHLDKAIANIEKQVVLVKREIRNDFQLIND